VLINAHGFLANSAS